MLRLSSLGILPVVFLAARVLAGPLDDPHTADTGFSGPTTGDLTAVYWNPAGLGLLRGGQAMIGGGWQSTSASVDRTGLPGASGRGTLHPVRWPPGQAGFAAIGAGFGHRFAIAMALYSPYSTALSMKSTAPGEPATRYHLVDMRLDHMAPAIGLAIHASESIQIGVLPGLLFPSAHMVFDEDTTLAAGGPVEDPAAAGRYDLASRGLQVPLYFLSLGAHYRRGRLSVGLAYTSAPLGTAGLVTLPMARTRVTPPGADTPLCNAPEDSLPDDCVVGQLRYRLPSIYTLGATWKTRGPWSFSGILRWLRYGNHDDVTALVMGPANGSPVGSALPGQVVLYRGFVDSIDTRARVTYETKSFRVAGTLRVESSAVPASHVNAAAIDGWKLGPQVAAELRVWRQLRVSASYAFTFMLPVDTGTSVFDPTAAARCTAAGGDLGDPACQARLQGQARPSAAGTYHLWRHALAVYTSVGF